MPSNPPPPVGSTFSKLYAGKTYTLTVVEKNGSVVYSLGFKSFKSPSAAAKYLVRNEVNGWEFWGMKSTTQTEPRKS